MAGEAESRVHVAGGSVQKNGRPDLVMSMGPLQACVEPYPVELREEPHQAVGGQRREVLRGEHAPAYVAAVGHGHAAAADGDAVVVGAPQVEEHLAAVGEAGVARPADLSQELGDGLGHDHVVDAHGKGAGELGLAGRPGAVGQDDLIGAHGAAGGLDRGRRAGAQRQHARALADAHAALETDAAQLAGQPGRLHRGQVGREDAAARRGESATRRASAASTARSRSPNPCRSSSASASRSGPSCHSPACP